MFEIEKGLEVDVTLVCKLDKDGNIRYVNQVYNDVTGFTEKDLVGESNSMIQHPKMPQIILDIAWKYINSGKHYFLISKNITKNGEYFWTIADITSKIFDGKSTAIYVRRKYLPSDIKNEISKLYEVLYGIEQSNNNGKEIAYKYLKGWLEDREFNRLEDYIISKFGSEKKLKEYMTTEISDKELFSTDPTDMDINDILKHIKKKKKRRFW